VKTTTESVMIKDNDKRYYHSIHRETYQVNK